MEMSGMVIEDGVPPPAGRGRRDPLALKLEAMRPGQSLLLSLGDGLDMKQLSKVAHRVFGKGGYRAARVEGGQARVWRLK